MKDKKGLIIVLGFLFVLFFINTIYAEIRINEVELNPKGPDSGEEWIELYSNEEVNLSGWIINNDGQNISLNQSFQGYLVIEFEKQWLDNSDEKITLIDGEGNEICETDILEDSSNDNKTWCYCDEWVFVDSSKELENNCEVFGEDSEEESENDLNESDDFDEEVELNESNEDSNEELEGEFVNKMIENNSIVSESIKLGSQKIDNQESENIKTHDYVIYESKIEKIKKYSVFCFALLCVMLCILIAWRKFE